MDQGFSRCLEHHLPGPIICIKIGEAVNNNAVKLQEFFQLNIILDRHVYLVGYQS